MRKIRNRTSIMLIHQMRSTVRTMIFSAAIGACCRQVTRKCLSLSHVGLFATPWTIAHQVPLSVGFSRQEYWSGLPFPSLGDFPDPGIEPGSPALQVESVPSEPPGNLRGKNGAKGKGGLHPGGPCLGEAGRTRQ